MTVIGFEWNQADDTVNHLDTLPVNKTLILKENEYRKFGENGWETVSTSLPNQVGFEEHGMDDLSIFDRKVQTVTDSPFLMENTGQLGEGKLFKKSINLTKYIDLRKLEVK